MPSLKVQQPMLLSKYCMNIRILEEIYLVWIVAYTATRCVCVCMYTVNVNIEIDEEPQSD